MVFGNRWAAGKWQWEERAQAAKNIATLELIPIVLSAKLWGGDWQRLRIEVETDNMAVARAGQNWAPKDKHLARLMRILAGEAIKNNFEIRFTHRPGHLMVDADALSRGKTSLFLARNPRANRNPDPVPRAWIDDLLLKE